MAADARDDDLQHLCCGCAASWLFFASIILFMRPESRPTKSPKSMETIVEEFRSAKELSAPELRRICPTAGEHANPLWHKPLEPVPVPDGTPTSMYWVINPQPSPRHLAMLSHSVRAALHFRLPAERLRLVVVVFEAGLGGVANASAIAFCRHVLPAPNATAGVVCDERVSTGPPSSCAVGDEGAWPLGAHSYVTVVRARDGWAQHPALRDLARLRRIHVDRHKAVGYRGDLSRFAGQVAFKWVADGVLLPLGVRRAIFRDVDTLSLASLQPLHRSPLGGPYIVAFAKLCMTDSFHRTERINVRHKLVQRLGFTKLSAQSINAGLFLMDFEQMCLRRGAEQLLQVARAAALGRQRLWSERAGTFDQPVAAIGLAANATFVDPRWNCRRPMAFLPNCYVSHSKQVLAGIAERVRNESGAPVDGGP